MRIAVPDQYGRNMLGVLDETKTLKYGQVFVQYSKRLTDPSAGFEILKGNFSHSLIFKKFYTFSIL